MITRRFRSLTAFLVLVVIAGLSSSLPTARAADPSAVQRYAEAGRVVAPPSRTVPRRLSSARTVRSHSSSITIGGDRVRVPSAAGMAIDRATRTLYVAELEGNRLRVIDLRSCTAQVQHCRPPVASIDLGDARAEELVIDHASGTLFAALPDAGAVAVVDVRRCTSRVTAGCTAVPARVPVGELPLGIDLDRRTRTVYVGDEQDQVSLIDAVACRAGRPAGCTAPLATVAAGPVSFRVLVDASRSTVYVANIGGDTVSVLDTRHCRRGDVRGCGRTLASVTVGAEPFGMVLDRATDTLYVSAQAPKTVVSIDAGTCNALDLSGCGRTDRPTAIAGVVPQFLAVDRRTRTLYAMDAFVDVITVLDVRRCHAHDSRGCEQPRRTIAIDGLPWAMLLDRPTGSLYQTALADSTLQVIDPLSCSNRRTDGCRHDAPTTESGGYGFGVDPTVHTLYGSRAGEGTLQLTDTRTCNVEALAGCQAAPATVPAGPAPTDLQVEPTTHTLYVTDGDDPTLRLYDTRRCNASRPQGCTPVATIPIGVTGTGIDVNRSTRTVYLADPAGRRLLVLTDCSAIALAGCSGPVRPVAIGVVADFPFIDNSTNTVYLPSRVDDGPGLLTLVDGDACDRGSAGCRVIATTAVGDIPISLDADPATHTAYIANNGYGEQPGTVSMLDTRTCSRLSTAGCGTTWPTARSVHSAFGVTVDRRTHRVYVSSFQAAAVAIMDGRRCNAGDQTGCPRRPLLVATGYVSAVTHIDPVRHTAYVLNSFDQTASLIDTRRPCRFGNCFRR